MTRTSLSQTLNLKQAPLQKRRKYCYFNEFPASRDAFLQLKKSHKKNHQRQAKIVEIVNYFIQKGKGICYSKNQKWIKMLEAEGFACCISTFDKDIAKLRKLNLIFTNSWNKPQRLGGGKIRHIITPWNIAKYEKDYIEALNTKGKGKPDFTKKAFYAYKEKIMKINFPAKHNVPNFPPRRKITSRSDRNNTSYIIPPIYKHKCYINSPPRGKTAQNREKRKTINPTEPAPEAKIASQKQRSCILHTHPMSDWNADWVNDPDWVTKEAVHQGCDEELVKKLVHAVQLKEIPLKTNLLRAILHVAKSKDQGYIDAVARITAGERILSGGQGVVLPQSSGIFMPKIDLSRLDSCIESNSVELDPNTLSTIECTLRSAGHYPVTGSY